MYMKQIVRKGDANTAGGEVIKGHPNITVNGKLLAKFMSSVTPHPPCPDVPVHCAAKAAFPGSIKVIANGIPALRVGDTDSCGHARAAGSTNVVCG
jgi:uncharacterized Zn-binding protein involved in type VI secretion